MVCDALNITYMDISEETEERASNLFAPLKRSTELQHSSVNIRM